jgi:hypothetical protein
MFKLNPTGRILNVKWMLLEATLIDIADIDLRNVSPAETEDHDIIRRHSWLVKEQSQVFNMLMRHFDVRQEQVFLAYCETLYAENLSVRSTSCWDHLIFRYNIDLAIFVTGSTDAEGRHIQICNNTVCRGFISPILEL